MKKYRCINNANVILYYKFSNLGIKIIREKRELLRPNAGRHVPPSNEPHNSSTKHGRSVDLSC